MKVLQIKSYHIKELWFSDHSSNTKTQQTFKKIKEDFEKTGMFSFDKNSVPADWFYKYLEENMGFDKKTISLLENEIKKIELERKREEQKWMN